MLPDNTRRRGKLTPVPPGEQAVATDTIIAPADTLVELSGYDKPLRSTRETMLVTNRLPRAITSLTLTITYLDLEGRELHQVTRTLNDYIPSGATRMVSFRSWDRQQSYWYHLGRPSRTPGTTPYTIRARVDSVMVEK